MTVKSIEQNIFKLSPVQRIQMVEKILESLDKPDPEIERAWIAESEKRFAAYKSGKVKASSFESFKKRLHR